MGSVYIWTHVRYVYFQCVYSDIRPICICPVCILGHTSDMYTFSVYTRSHVRYVYFQCVYLDKRPICILRVYTLGPHVCCVYLQCICMYVYFECTHLGHTSVVYT